MRLNYETILLFIVGILVSLPIEGQRRKSRFDLMQGTKLTPMVGLNAFFGDLVDESRASYSFGSSFEREMSQIISARAHIMAGEMKGTQISPNSGGLKYAYFKNQYIEFGVGATLRLMDLAFGYYKQRTFNPYAIGQIGINYFDATEWYGNGAGNFPESHPLAGLPRENTIWHEANTITPVITLGGGISYWMSPRISIRGEFLANQPFSDMLDAHEEWEDNQGVVTKTDGVDFYYTATVGISIVLKDSRWRNEPKYNRKSYIKLRNYNMGGGNRTKFRTPRRR